MNHAARPSPDIAAAAAAWITRFAAALAQPDAAALAAAFLPDAHWRDLLAFTWTIQTTSGATAIAAALVNAAPKVAPTNLRLSPDRTAPRHVTRAGTPVIEAFFTFDTNAGRVDAVARLVTDPAGTPRCWSLATALQSLRGHPEIDGRHQAEGVEFSRDFGAENWLDKRNRARAYADHDPAVIVVGGGQAGLGIAARLSRLGVDTLIVDREARVGDNWRKRYHALTLHNEVHVNDLPYMPFPPSFPVFIPKDKLANWFEAYVEAMDLNFWTSTELVHAAYDDTTATWTTTIRRADGSERVMRPRHLVFATGVSSIPVITNLPGLETFAGTVLHSSAYTDGTVWNGRRAFVLGTGNSGHDVAQDLHCAGAHVTMIQRSPSYVVSLPEAQSVYAIYNEGIPIADCDLLATAMPYSILKRAYQLSTAASRKVDQPLHDALAARGFQLTFGEDETGFQMMYLRRGGGYYFNVGCSDLIANGDITLIQYDSIAGFTPQGARLASGQTIPADLIVLATGYKNQQDVARTYLGDTIADKIGPVWGFDHGGELRNMWKPTNQPGLWFTAGSLAQCRIFSRYLALQIKARETGIVG